MMPTVSIIVPVYNAEKYIEATIKMVQKQSYENWELILINDCSKDNSAKVIEELVKLDDRLRLYTLSKNSGAAEARNFGVSKAEGRYIAFLDADDIWLEDKLKNELEFMKEQDAAFAYTAYEFGDEDGRPTGKIVKVWPKLGYKQALSRTIIFTSTVMFDTEKISKELISMPKVESEDTATWWKILRNGYEAYGLNEVLVIYRRPSNSLSSNKFVALKRIWNLYRKCENLSLIYSAYNFVFWAYRATVRRL